MSQPKIPKNKKDPDYDPHLKKHYTATPSDTGTTEQPIVKSVPLLPASILGKVILSVIVVVSFAQLTGLIDVTGFLDPNSPKYLDVGSILSPSTKSSVEKLPYGEDSPDDDVGLDDSFMGRDLIKDNPQEDSASDNQHTDICQKYSGTSFESGNNCCVIQKGSGGPSSEEGIPDMPDVATAAFLIPSECNCPTDTTDYNDIVRLPDMEGTFRWCDCNAC